MYHRSPKKNQGAVQAAVTCIVLPTSTHLYRPSVIRAETDTGRDWALLIVYYNRMNVRKKTKQTHKHQTVVLRFTLHRRGQRNEAYWRGLFARI